MTLSEEAIEAAAKVHYEHVWSGSDWNSAQLKEIYRRRARAYLEAALPSIEKEIREQVGQELYDKLPVKLGETAASEDGWLSDLQYVSPETSADFERVELSYGGSIDLYHITEYAARIAGGTDHD